jgi:hypothetical protein
VFLAAVAFHSSVTGIHRPKGEAKMKAFEKVLASPPSAARVTDYAYERFSTGRGCYIFVFLIPKEELRLMLNQNGFVKVAIDSDPGSWRLSLINSMVARILDRNIQISTNAECFERKAAENTARVFYDGARQEVILFGSAPLSVAGMPELESSPKTRPVVNHREITP